MKVMILAAGKGERMRPLTDFKPKPLLPVADKTIIEYTIDGLVASGFKDLVINHAYLGQQIEDYLGDGERYGANIQYSPEGDRCLETAGGIINALPLLGEQPFMVVNGDIATDFPFEQLKNQPKKLAHLVLVQNPVHHTQGDFGLLDNAQLVNKSDAELFTFCGIGVYDPQFFSEIEVGHCKLGQLLRQAIDDGQVTGQLFRGFWMDIGTPERLCELNDRYSTHSSVVD